MITNQLIGRKYESQFYADLFHFSLRFFRTTLYALCTLYVHVSYFLLQHTTASICIVCTPCSPYLVTSFYQSEDTKRGNTPNPRMPVCTQYICVYTLVNKTQNMQLRTFHNKCLSLSLKDCYFRYIIRRPDTKYIYIQLWNIQNRAV